MFCKKKSTIQKIAKLLAVRYFSANSLTISYGEKRFLSDSNNYTVLEWLILTFLPCF